MKSPKNYKQLLGIGMCFCLTFHGVAYGQMNFQPTIQENSGRWAASSNVLYQETRFPIWSRLARKRKLNLWSFRGGQHKSNHWSLRGGQHKSILWAVKVRQRKSIFKSASI